MHAAMQLPSLAPVRGAVRRSRGAVRARAATEPPVAPPSAAAPPPPPAAAAASSAPPVMLPPLEAKANAARPVPVSFGAAMAFTGAAPETVNGRLAMLGFVAAAGAELSDSGPILEQASAYAVPIAAVAALLSVASLVPIMAGSKAQGWGPFSSEAETTNGRTAMVAFMLLCCLEQLYNNKFFG